MGSEISTQPITYYRDVPFARDAPEFLDVGWLQELCLYINNIPHSGTMNISLKMNVFPKSIFTINKNTLDISFICRDIENAEILM